MNDVINRKDAIGAILSVEHIAELSDGDAVIRVSAVNYVLGNLPPAQPGWIPCTPETMPEREGRYVCTYTYDGKKDVFMFRFEDGDFLVPWYVDAITAWYKPLDPWKGGQDG